MNDIREFRYKFMLRYLLSPSSSKEYSKYIGKRKCIVCLAADYGNLGDVAITYAQIEFLRRKLVGYEVIDFPISKTLKSLKALKNVCTPDDIITVVGGGNMGDMYFDIELLRLMVVKNFKNNHIILFPQTIDYSNTPRADYLKRLGQRVYTSHPNLLMCAREIVSYEMMKKLYPKVRVELVPDIVMSLDERLPKHDRTGVVFCMRNDSELGPRSHVARQLREKLVVKYMKLYDYDTHIGRNGLSIVERKSELSKIWERFRQSKWVVTDRLHGMIFAFITGTPAVVFPNCNFKIAGCYEWIKDCGYIHFVDNMEADEILALMQKEQDSDAFDTTHQEILKMLDVINCSKLDRK